MNNKENSFGLKVKHIHMGLFDFSIVAIIGDYEKVTPFIKWKFDDKEFDSKVFDMEYEPRGKVFFRQGYVPVLWIPRKPKTPREHATLAHEALHCVFHLFEWAAIPITRDTEEVMTHSMAHIINETLK